jgi:hypothetical protein
MRHLYLIVLLTSCAVAEYPCPTIVECGEGVEAGGACIYQPSLAMCHGDDLCTPEFTCAPVCTADTDCEHPVCGAGTCNAYVGLCVYCGGDRYCDAVEGCSPLTLPRAIDAAR